MRWSGVINGLGVLAATAYTGYAFTPSHVPLWGGVGALLFLVALIVPLAAEYGSLDRGFQDIGGDFVQSRQRERGLGPAVEVFSKTPPAKTFRRSSRSQIIAMIITVAAISLVTYDFWQWQESQPPAPENQGVITNF